MGQDLNWNDLRLFLAACRTGNLRAAAQTVALDQSTLCRRIEALESSMKATLFMRSNRGIVPTDAGHSLRLYAEQLESTVIEIERVVCGQDTSLQGTIKIASIDGFGPFWLTPRLRCFQEQNPGIDIDLMCSEQETHNRGKAHVMFQLGQPSQEDLISRGIGEVQFQLFASANYLARAGNPKTSDQLLNGLHRFVVSREVTSTAHDGSNYREAWAPWLSICSRPAAVSFATNSYAAQAKATLAGFGISLLPTYFEEQWPDLVRLEPEGWVVPSAPIAMVYHESIKQSKRVKLLIDYLLKSSRLDFAA